MARDFVVNGPCLVKVRGASGGRLNSLSQLGLAAAEARISPRFYYQDMIVDDFGPHVPAEVHWALADVTITMTLIHFDETILEACWIESMGGEPNNLFGAFGQLVGAGRPMGGGQNPGQANCHYISLNLTSPVLKLPWNFPTAYLTGQPLDYLIGAAASLVPLSWRAIPYANQNAALTNTVTFTGEVLFGANQVIATTSVNTSQLAVGMTITGGGAAAGCTIESVFNASTIIVSSALNIGQASFVASDNPSAPVELASKGQVLWTRTLAT